MKSSAKLDCLDGLRGIAVLAVIVFHHRLECESHVRSAFYPWLAPSRLGYLGVHLFLVLSGFCMTLSLIRRSREGRSPTLNRFLSARFWRIAPPYYLAMVLYLAASWSQVELGLSPLRNEPNTIRQVLMHLGFLHGLRGDTIDAINSPFWSLSLEFQFYAILPLLFALSERIGYRWIIAVATTSSLVWRAGVLRAIPNQTFLLNGFFLGRWAEFAFGMGVASWYTSIVDSTSDPSRKLGKILLAAGLALVTLGAAMTARGSILVVDTTIGLGFALVLMAVLLSDRSGGRLGRWIASPALVRAGVISYSLYLTHSLILAWVDRGYARLVTQTSVVSEVALLAIATVMIAAFGLLFFQVVERRFIRSIDAASKSPGVRGASIFAGPATLRPTKIDARASLRLSVPREP